MQYAVVFLEGIITFISPCLLPMLPVYVSYFLAGEDSGNSRRALRNALAFVLGFTILFVAMGVFAGTAGRFLIRWQTVVNLVTGAIVVLLGLGYLGVIPLRFGGFGAGAGAPNGGFFRTVLFGMVFAVGWTPCVGAFLGSALMLASQQGSITQGAVMLLIYSLGLGIPFVLAAVLIDKFKAAFDFIKRHYRVVNAVSGAFLIAVGITMMFGWFGKFIALLA